MVGRRFRREVDEGDKTTYRNLLDGRLPRGFVGAKLHQNVVKFAVPC